MGVELPEIGIIILAGGEGKRMGGADKGWCMYQKQPMIERVLTALKTQYQSLYGVESEVPIVISANRNLSAYETLGYSVVTDRRSGFCGPLAGVESVLSAGHGHSSKIERWVTYPVDAPNVPTDYLEKMVSVGFDRFGVWEAEGRVHFANLSLPVGIQLHLTQYLNLGNRSIKGWLVPYSHQTDYIGSRCFSGQKLPFLNLNQVADLL